MRRGTRLRLLAGLACCGLLLGLAPLTQAVSKPRFTPFRVHGEPMRAVTLTDIRQFAALSVPDLERLRSDGFNTVSIYAYRFVSDVYDSSVESGVFTETDASIGAAIDAAHAVGLAVQLVPVVWVGNGTSGFVWRGYIRPSDPDAFFDSYRYMLNHYADLAQQHGVELFGIGSEMTLLEYQGQQWIRTAAEVRQHYSGPLTYFTVQSRVEKIRWWSAVDYPGISPYYSLSAAARPSYDEVVGAWRSVHLPALRKASAYVGKPLLVSEIGYASTPGAATHPESAPAGVPDESLQADLYRAFLSTVLPDRSVDGVSFYRWSAYEAGPANGGFSPKGKSAECVLAKAWAPTGTSALSCGSFGRVIS